MKNNDFDFIKQKFDESGVNAPDKLNEEFVRETIKHVEPLKVKKSKKKYIVSGIIAASVAFLIINALLITNLFSVFKNGLPFIPGSSEKNNVPVAEAKIKNFESRDEVTSEIKSILDNKAKRSAKSDPVDYFAAPDEDAAEAPAAENSEKSAGAADSGTSDLTSSDSHSETYIQTKGVDEADTIKTDGEYIYYCKKNSTNTIEIFKASNGKTEPVSTISVPDRLTNKNYSFKEFYVNGSKLTAIAGTPYSAESLTSVCVYDVSDKKNNKLENCYTQSGKYCSSRMIDGKVYTVSTYYANQSDCIPECYGNTSYELEGSKEIAPDCIYCVDEPDSANFLVISAADTEKNAQNIKSKAILGSAEDVYCSTENLYVLAKNYDRTYYESDGYLPPENYSSYTQIVKVNLKNDIDFTATAKVKGEIDDQYALDEKDGNLRIATTSKNSKNRDTNNLFVLDKNLNEIGSVTGFANNESIRAVKYVGNTAYVITYEQTDPLFIIDLTDPKDPEITGEVMISGFSTMLVPVDEKTLLGIGYDTESSTWGEKQSGLKLATFDISDKNYPKVIDTKVFMHCSSAVQNNQRALVNNPDRNDYVIPLNYCNNQTVDSYYPDDSYDAHSGTLNFKVEKGNIKVTEEYTSMVFGEDKNNCPVDRCVYIGDYIYMLGSRFTGYYTATDDAEEKGPAVNTHNDIIIDSVKYK